MVKPSLAGPTSHLDSCLQALLQQVACKPFLQRARIGNSQSPGVTLLAYVPDCKRSRPLLAGSC